MNKSKVVVFRKGGHLGGHDRWHIGNTNNTSKHQQLLLLCSSHALEGQIFIIKLWCNYLIAKWSAPNSLSCCIIDKTRIKKLCISDKFRRISEEPEKLRYHFIVVIPSYCIYDFGKNKEYGNFVSISSLTGECAAEKFKNFCSSSLWICLHHMVILKSQNKITDFFMILDLYHVYCNHPLRMLKAAPWDDINFRFLFCIEVVYPTDHDFIIYGIF